MQRVQQPDEWNYKYVCGHIIPTDCTSEMHFEICPPARSLARLPHPILPADLKEQLLAVDVVDQESVVLVHHGQLVA